MKRSVGQQFVPSFHGPAMESHIDDLVVPAANDGREGLQISFEDTMFYLRRLTTVIANVFPCGMATSSVELKRDKRAIHALLSGTGFRTISGKPS